MDAGGLAQMTYNNQNFPLNNALGLPSNGFATRGKGAHIKRLSVAPPSNIGSINENGTDIDPAPRTSRSHLLAGLRTAPKNQAVPASAPYNQTQHWTGSNSTQIIPQTASAPNFPYTQSQTPAQSSTPAQTKHYMSQQPLAPPALNINGVEEQMDPQMYDELMATNMYLAQRQQQLQQQLINVTAAAQQFGGMNINGQMQNAGSPMTSQAYGGFYQQQMQQGMQPVIQPVPNQPGVFTVYNPMTGQFSYAMDPNAQQGNMPLSPPPTAGSRNFSSDAKLAGIVRSDNASPPSAATAAGWTRTFTPPRKSPSPTHDVAPLPEPSANAYRPGHRKSLSSMASKSNIQLNAALRAPAIAPQTPMTGTFGPGMSRTGEHPVRQPRGPPPLEELISKPTVVHEGSKNFATRQRRRALFSLVSAGKTRNARRGGSGDAGTPVSESELNFAVHSSDAGSDATESGSLSGQSSSTSLRAVANGVIGSEAKERSRERQTLAHRLSSSNDNVKDNSPSAERRKMPMLILTSAEKRKGSSG